MSSRVISIDSLRMPNRHERPKFDPDTPLDVQAHIWATWLEKRAARRRISHPASPAITLSADGAQDLALLIVALASRGA